jgi:hypothetical protein
MSFFLKFICWNGGASLKKIMFLKERTEKQQQGA